MYRDALKGADVFIGVSAPGVVKPVSARWPDRSGRFTFVLPASMRGRTVRLWDGEVLKNFPGRGQWMPRKRPASLIIKR